MFEKYIDKSFSKKSLALIQLANQIITEYQDQGYDLTLRQLYYQMVARDILPNQQKQYKRLGGIVGDARLAGLLPWDAIVDRTRNVHRPSAWGNPAEIISSAAHSYAVDLWAGQTYRVEVWVEKDALRGVVSQSCAALNVPHFSCRGYSSLSEMWVAGSRIKRWIAQDVTPAIIHLGDHDPSGMDMTRDIIDRLEMFAGATEGSDFLVRRAALNLDQIRQHNPPPNPAKLTDSRYQSYAEQFGKSSWELDALDPATLDEIITSNIEGFRDDALYMQRYTQQEAGRRELMGLAQNYSAAIAALNGGVE